MNKFPIHTTVTANDTSARILRDLQTSIGFIPNVFSVVAESSIALEALVNLSTAFSACSLTSEEQQLIQLIVSTENSCGYCVAGHTAFSDSLAISSDVVEAVRTKQPISNRRFNALNVLVRALIKNKGRIDKNVLNQFFSEGYTQAQFFEVLLGVSIKTISNYTSLALSLPLDDEFQPYAWHDTDTPKRHVA